MQKCYLVLTVFNDIPKVIGVFSTREKAEKVAYSKKFWCNVVEKEINKEYD